MSGASPLVRGSRPGTRTPHSVLFPLHPPPRRSQLHPLAHILLEHSEPSFHPCRDIRETPSTQGPFLPLWRGGHGKWSLRHHENTQISRDVALAPRWMGVFVTILSKAQKPAPTCCERRCRPELPAKRHIPPCPPVPRTPVS